MKTTMRAAVCVRAGGPEVLEIRELPVPAVREGWSLVRVMAAGLNRSELRTRQGHSPGVTFPRVLGIECVGVVAASTDPALPEGTTVAAVMGEMGRAFDGGYAEYALLPNALLMPVTTTLPWEVLAALPETYLTAQGALDALGVRPGERLLIRGGTSSVGLAAASIAHGEGIEVAATTRRPEKAAALAAVGVDHVLVDDGASLRPLWPSQVVDGVLLDDGGSPGSPWPAGPSRVLLDDGGAPGSPWPAGPSQVVDRVLLDDGGAPGSPWPAGPSHVVDHVLLDDGGSARPLWPGGPSHVLDLVGARTVVDSLRLVSRGGTVCVAGSLSGWLIREFEPIAMIPSGTRLTAFHSDDAKGRAGTAVLQRVVRKVEAGLYRPNIDRVFGLDDIVAAHRHMETNQAAGKVVLVTGS